MIRTLTLSIFTFLAMTLSASAGGEQDYKPGLIQSLLAEGKTLLVDYKASWCTTCARQERVINQLRKENPAYDKAITFVAVDWDEYGRHDVTTSRNVPRRSTLLVLRGNEELARIVAGTSVNDIKALMDKAL